MYLGTALAAQSPSPRYPRVHVFAYVCLGASDYEVEAWESTDPDGDEPEVVGVCDATEGTRLDAAAWLKSLTHAEWQAVATAIGDAAAKVPVPACEED